MGPFNQGKSSLDRILWVVIFIWMVVNSLRGPFSMGTFFLMPVPLIILDVLISPAFAGMVILGTTVLFAAEKNLFGGAAFFLMIGVFSQIQGYMIRKGSCISKCIFWGTSFVLCTALLLIPLGAAFGTDAGYLLLASVAEDLKTSIRASDYGQDLTAAELAGFLPFFILYLIFIFTASNFFLSRWVLQIKGVPVIPLGILSEFQLPQRIFEGSLFLMGMAYGLKMAGWQGGQAVLDTLVFLMAFVFMFQGLGVCSYFMKKQGVPAVWQPMILAGLVLLAGPLGLSLAGFADVMMDLRKQRRTGGSRR